MSLHSVLVDLTITTSVLCALITIYKYNIFLPIEKRFAIFIIGGACFEMIATTLMKVAPSGNNLPGLHAYTLFQFVALFYFFVGAYKTFGFHSKYLNIFVNVGIAAIILNSVFFQSIFVYNSVSKTFVEFSVLAGCIAFFFFLISDKNYDIARTRPLVAFVTGVFLNSAVSIIHYLFSNYVLEMERSLSVKIAILHVIVNLITYLMFALGVAQIILRNIRQSG